MEFFRKTTRFPFMGTRHWAYGISGALVALSIVFVIIRGLNFGIDFTGGVLIEAHFDQPVNLDEVRGALEEDGFTEAMVQNFGSPNDIVIRMPPEEGPAVVQRTADEQTGEGEEVQNTGVGARVLATLQRVNQSVELQRVEAVGAQVGEELAEKGALALLFTLILILIYVMFRFEWKLGVGAVLAAAHDPLIILGVFAAFDLTFDMTVIAAMLATIGYSLNDTVVVFDRARDCFRSMRTATPAETMDAAVNQTLSRTIITSGTTLLVLIVLLLFGGDALHGFSLALIIGVVVGTYSSIYIAGAIAVDLKLTAQDLMPPKKVEELDGLP